MPSSEETEYLVKKIDKYVRQLKDNIKVGHALQRLQSINMTVDLLSRTAVGKVVNKLRSDEEWGDLASDIVDSWKEVARRNGIRESESTSSTPNSGCAESSQSEESVRHRKRKDEQSASSSSSSTSQHKPKKAKMAPVMDAFAAALSAGDKMKEPVRQKKMKPFDYTMDLDMDYRPLPQLNLSIKSSPMKGAMIVNGGVKEDDPSEMFKPRKGQTKVFGGRKKAVTMTEVPRLFDLCIKVIQNHINDIDSTGSIPFSILRPILEKATWIQLADIEKRNQYLEEDTDELWEKLCAKHHAGKKTYREETWKEMFMRCEVESQSRLKKLSERITNNGTTAEKNVRKAMTITDVKLPKFARNRQRKFGTSTPSTIEMPHALEVSKARKDIFERGSKAALSTIPSGVRNLNSNLGSHSSSSKKTPPKTGALMKKTLKMLGRKSTR